MRLILHAIVHQTPPWIGIKRVDRPYPRVPVAGESIQLGDEPDSLPWDVAHVAWSNAGTPSLTLGFDPDDYEFGGIQMLEAYGFRELKHEAPPRD